MHDWELEFASPEAVFKALKETREDLVRERSKNAYIAVTGKSIVDIQFDGIHEMLTKVESTSASVKIVDIEQYAESLTT